MSAAGGRSSWQSTLRMKQRQRQPRANGPPIAPPLVMVPSAGGCAGKQSDTAGGQRAAQICNADETDDGE